MLNEQRRCYSKRERPFAGPISEDGVRRDRLNVGVDFTKSQEQQSHVKGKFELQKEEVINDKQAHFPASVWASVPERERRGRGRHIQVG